MATEAHARLATAVGHLRQQGAGLDARHTAAEAQAAMASATAGERLASALAALRAAGINVTADDVASPAWLTELASRRERREARLAQLAYLEGRWFQLSGLARLAEGEADAQRQVVTDLGDSLVGAANVVCCTTTGFGGDADIRDADFDTLIVDEASRVIDSEFLIGAKQARRWVLVGDEHQLPPHVNPADEHHLHALAALHMTGRGAADDLHAAVSYLAGLWREDEEVHQFRTSSVEGLAASLSDSGLWQKAYSREYQKAYDRLRADGADAERELLRKMRHHLVQSIFERCVADGPKELRGPLIQQHRMIDPIAALVRDPVYHGNYLTPPPGNLRVTPLTTSRTFPEPVVFLDTSGYPSARETQEGSGCYNELEARLVADACRAWDRELAAQGERDVTVSVLAFYKAQARKIRQRLGAPRFKGFRVLRFRDIDSIDRLQGQESDLIIISFCRATPGRQHLWLQDVRRLNVACTRAKRGIVLIGHKNTLAGLRGVPAAEGFYAHMFSQFATGAPGTVLLRQLEGTSR
jgi:AAA domain